MIRISVTKGADRWCMTAFGHAGYERGNDIVCAAFSMLVYQLANLLHDLNAGMMTDNGHTIFVQSENPGAAALMVWRGFLCGAEMLEETYPYHVKLTVQQTRYDARTVE